MKSLLSVFFWPFYIWALISALNPSQVSNTQFIHIPKENGLSIAISKSSPPLVALLAEELPLLKEEPEEELPRGQHIQILAAGHVQLQPKIQVLAKAFIMRSQIQRKLEQRALAQVQAVVVRPVLVQPKTTKITELLRMVAPVATVTPAIQTARTQDLTINSESPKESLGSVGSVGSVWVKGEDKPVASVAQASRSLPRGEERPVAIIPNQPTSTNRPDIQMQMIKGLSNSSAEAIRINGVAELRGGLALTQDINDLKVFWKTGVQTVSGTINNKGEFAVDVPMISTGKIIVTLSDSKKSVLGRGDVDLNEASVEQINRGLKIYIDPLNVGKSGEVVSAYSFDQYKVFVPGAYVTGPNHTYAEVDLSGRYELRGIASESSLVLEAGAPDHWGTRIITDTSTKETIPLFSHKMIRSFSELVGATKEVEGYGIVWGVASKRGAPVAGVTVSTPTASVIGPIYFNELRLPDKKLKSTSSNGIFAFVKVPKGLHIIQSQLGGLQLPHSIVSTSQGFVSYVDLKMKAIAVKGQVYDPLLNSALDSVVQVLGSPIQGLNSKAGFDFKNPSSEPILFLNATASGDYLALRKTVSRIEAKGIDVPMFQKSWLGDQLTKNQIYQSPQQGILLGRFEGPEYRIALDGEPTNDNQVFFFNGAGEIVAHKAESEKTGGSFLMTNLKTGLHTLLIMSTDGEIVKSQVIISEPGVLNYASGKLTP